MAGTRIYSPQLGDDISSGISNLGALFGPPKASDLVAQQGIATAQAAAAQKANAIAALNAVSPTLGAMYGVGDNDAVRHYTDLNNQNDIRSGKVTNPAQLDSSIYARDGNAANTFTGQQAKPLGENESRALSPGLAQALGVPQVQHGVIDLGNDASKVLPGGPGQTQIVTSPNANDEDPDKAPKWGVIGEDQFGAKQYGYPPPYVKPAATPTVPSMVQSPVPVTPGAAPQPAATASAPGAAPAAQTVPAQSDNGSQPPTPAPAATQPQQPAATPTKGDVTQLHGDDFLATLDPAMAGQVKAVVQGRAPYPTGMMLKTPFGQKLATYVTQTDPSFESGNATARVKVRNEFETGGPNTPAGAVTAGNTALNHLADLSDASEAMGGTSFPAANGVINAIQQQTGGGIPLTRYNNTLRDFAGEATKFYRGVGGSEGDINGYIASLNPNASPDQRRAAIQQQATLMSNKVAELQNRWHTGMGPMSGDFPIISPQGQASLDRINSRVAPQPAPTQTSSVGAGPGGSDRVVGAITGQQPSASSPQATPPAAGDPMSMARAAIARGAPRDAVIQRLQQNGINPTGL